MASDEQSKQPQRGNGARGSGEKAENGSGKQTRQSGGTDAIELLKSDHRAVEKLFADYESTGNRARKVAIIRQVAQMLKIHAELEEAIFYPAVRDKVDADDDLDEAQVEHDTLKLLIADLESGGQPEYRDAKVKVLSEYVKHHVKEEEAEDGILEQGRKAGLDLMQLGTEMAELKEELEEDPDQIRSEPVSLQSLVGRSQRGRAEQGGRSTRSARGDDRRGRDEPERDERGRFMSADDEDNDRRSLRGRRYEDYDDDYDRRGRAGNSSRGGEGDGRGWHGDPRGHSQAARRGWDDRR